ncbi:HpcH/HpaI aldolase/citrate lyase family protein [Arthrobacter sp. 35W]|uniref:HpcH/HpaI aldolase/citrate lyase family protein n=1 Tax=Arthrobacter sp. 35W TaxID=1132441 RepID=UPI0003F5877E|nr:HpcH/HpaI aldolase/citrate lyase family protein [Arthrobacter sp. 35W]
MRHFNYLSPERSSQLFYRQPEELHLDSDPALLAVALGATLYTPGNRPTLVRDIDKQGAAGCTSMVLCLEDSIADDEVAAAEENVVATLAELHRGDTGPDASTTVNDRPLLFVRVRTPEQMEDLARRAGSSLDVLAGFVIPKFDDEAGAAQRFLDALHRIHRDCGQGGEDGRRRLRIMPILESAAVIHTESRARALTNIRRVLRENREDILAVRIGATDMSSAFGLRRSRDLTIYDVKVVAAVIADIVNVLGRPEDGYVISGPVWEHFSNGERLLRPQLRATPFAEADEEELRGRILLANLDGLMREIGLDHANGLLGKTIIHPTHIPLVHAMSVVTHEEYLDAMEIHGKTGGGAAASPYGNKMNEMKPHQSWAAQTLLRAKAFGVAAEGVGFVDLLEASMA